MKFTVITSAYQQKHLINKTFESLQAQTLQDFEWVIADDGSTDGLKEWVEAKFDGVEVGFPVKYVRHEKNIGYRYGQIINKAVAETHEGEYLVWCNADSYMAPDFLEKMAKVLTPNRLVNGVRLNMNEDGTIASEDWRLSTVMYDDNAEILNVGIYSKPWDKMTLNSMAMPREMFNNIGGMFDGYIGYGKEDWDLCMRAFYLAHAEFWWALKAIVYTENHKPKDEVPQNKPIFLKRLAEFSADPRVQEKIAAINDPANIERSKQMIEEKRRILENSNFEEKEDL